jgi:glycosyltransferase involved in cell wall biosynthesis
MFPYKHFASYKNNSINNIHKGVMNIYDIDSIKVSADVPGISVLIPLYNGIEYLEQSAGSVIQQTYKSWQLIIGINGHTQNSEIEHQAKSIIDKLDADKKYDILVKYYDTKGKANTMNAMVADSKYEYIAILDVDDYWVPDKLEIQVPYLTSYDVVGGKCEYFGVQTGSPPIPIGAFTSFHNIFDYNPVINSSAIIHKRDATWEDENYVRRVEGLDDYSLWFKLYYFKRKFYNINKVLCYHRIHLESSFNFQNNDKVHVLKQLWSEFFRTH